jgi:Domain of unknown function (DU1801)
MSPRSPSFSQVNTLIGQYDPELQKLINAARNALALAFPRATETPDTKARVIGYCYRPGYKGTVATLILSKTGVKIGIPYGAHLPDPSSLLAGEGKVHRHIAVTELAQLKAPAVKALLKETLSAWQARTAAAKD